MTQFYYKLKIRETSKERLCFQQIEDMPVGKRFGLNVNQKVQKLYKKLEQQIEKQIESLVRNKITIIEKKIIQSKQQRLLGKKKSMKKFINQEEQYDQINTNTIKIEESQDDGDSNSIQIVQQLSNETKKTNKWTQKEDEVLKKLVQNFGEKNWRKISSMMEGRSAIQCLHRWSKILKPGLVKGRKQIKWVVDYAFKSIMSTPLNQSYFINFYYFY